MSCYSPNYMLDLGLKPNGKRNLKMLPKRADSSLMRWQYLYGKESIVSVPCGKCLGCRLDHAKEWAFRCVCEASEYGDNNSFITLTYDDEHCPSNLVKDHFKQFIKSIRNAGYKIRYFGCGEYGGSGHTQIFGQDVAFGRPHYHILVFNYFPKDIRVWDSKKCLFTSKEVESFWPFGRAIIGYVSYQSAGYVARYTLKKRYDPSRTDEFILMSLKPGIGQKYIVEHALDYSDRDFFIKFIGNKNTIINHFRYADKILDQCWFDISHLKEKRSLSAEVSVFSSKVLYGLANIEQINMAREIRKTKQVANLRRGL